MYQISTESGSDWLSYDSTMLFARFAGAEAGSEQVYCTG